MLFRFIEAILHQQGLAEIIFGLIIIRPRLQSGSEVCLRLGKMTLSLQDNTQIVMGEPAIGVLRQRVLPKRLNIPINWTLPPRQEPQNEDWNT